MLRVLLLLRPQSALKEVTNNIFTLSSSSFSIFRYGNLRIICKTENLHRENFTFRRGGRRARYDGLARFSPPAEGLQSLLFAKA